MLNRREFIGSAAILPFFPSLACSQDIAHKKQSRGISVHLGHKFIYGKLPVEVSYKEYPFDIDFPLYVINLESTGDNHSDILNVVRQLYPEAKKNNSKMWIYVTKARIIGIIKWN